VVVAAGTRDVDAFDKMLEEGSDGTDRDVMVGLELETCTVVAGTTEGLELICNRVEDKIDVA
jgi:hypothetical protein